jgi:predicted transcriptional regulator
MEINALRLEPNCHPSIFLTICRHLHDYSDRFLRNVNRNIIRNISHEEFEAIKTLRNNKDIVISRADKGNAIVIMNKEDYIEKIKNILQLKQFKHTNKSLLNEKEEEMNRYLRQLQKDNVINKELFYKIHSTCSSLSCMYGQIY